MLLLLLVTQFVSKNREADLLKEQYSRRHDICGSLLQQLRANVESSSQECNLVPLSIPNNNHKRKTKNKKK